MSDALVRLNSIHNVWMLYLSIACLIAACWMERKSTAHKRDR